LGPTSGKARDERPQHRLLELGSPVADACKRMLGEVELPEKS
jgi:hypothetical protein